MPFPGDNTDSNPVGRYTVYLVNTNSTEIVKYLKCYGPSQAVYGLLHLLHKLKGEL